MNTRNPHPTRVICRLARLASTLGLRRENGAASRHLDSCPACRAWSAQRLEFERRLTRDARQLARPAPAGLETFIMAGVRQQLAQARAVARRSWQPVAIFATLAAGAAALAIAVVFLLRTPAPSADTLAAHDDYDHAVIAEAAAAVEALPAMFRQTVATSASRLTQGNALLAEIDLVYADARSALDFLALNFLPGDTASSGAGSDADLHERQG